MYQLVLQFPASAVGYDALIALEDELIRAIGEICDRRGAAVLVHAGCTSARPIRPSGGRCARGAACLAL
jgi:hypothetical protein